MNGTDVTFGRALKIWWSYVWRAILLMLPVMVVAMLIIVAILPLPKAGEVPRPDQIPGLASKMFGLWLFMMVFYIAAQVQAMRWMLKTKWSDFRLQAISDN